MFPLVFSLATKASATPRKLCRKALAVRKPVEGVAAAM